jgi:hypothetical protein
VRGLCRKERLSMKPILVAVVAGVLVCGICPPLRAADNYSERPFGGPPPPRGGDRGLKLKGFICRTPSGTCRMTASRPVGSECACPSGSSSQAGKVER